MRHWGVYDVYPCTHCYLVSFAIYGHCFAYYCYCFRLLNHADIKGGQYLEVTFDIWDSLHDPSTSIKKESDGLKKDKKYIVTFTRGTSKLDAMETLEFTEPGRYTALLHVAPPETITLVVGLTTQLGLYYEDVVTVSD